jgi:uncharacterized metal-binding protein
MPGAQTHDAITVASGIALAPLSYVALLNLSQPTQVAAANTLLLIGGHLLSGILFSPDLDLDSRIDNRWGIFYWIWRPYMWAVPHRNFWSHGLVLPPLLRLLYFYLVVIVLLLAMAWVGGRLGLVVPDYPARLTAALLRMWRDHPHEVLAFMAGFVTGGAAHTIADWLVTSGKHYLRRLGLRVAVQYANHDRYIRHSHRGRSSSWER